MLGYSLVHRLFSCFRVCGCRDQLLLSSEVQQGCDLLVENNCKLVTTTLAGFSRLQDASPSSSPAMAVAQAAFVKPQDSALASVCFLMLRKMQNYLFQ